MNWKGDDVVVFLIVTGVFFLVLVLRYFIVTGLFYYHFYLKSPEKYMSKRLSSRNFRKDQVYNEILWSFISSLIFAVIGAVTYVLWQNDATAIYIDISVYGIWYVPLSLILLLFLHETYYYWVHRLMHHPKIFKHVHKVHHDSLTPTPFTAFSFHPWEALLEAIILPILLVIIPVNIWVLVSYLIIMTFSSVINHLDIEIYSQRFMNSAIGKWFIGATHHHYHHSEFKTNYGLYFTFWDRWMGTESSKMQHKP